MRLTRSNQSKSYLGPHTKRSIENFQISNFRLHNEQIEALALIKLSCAKANLELKLLPSKIGNAIIKASKEVINGNFHNLFVIDIFQSGSGTSSNMNINEIIASRSNEILTGKINNHFPVHPNQKFPPVRKL